MPIDPKLYRAKTSARADAIAKNLCDCLGAAQAATIAGAIITEIQARDASAKRGARLLEVLDDREA